MDIKKKREIIAFVWLAIAALLFLCLVSYTPQDIPFEISTPNQPVKNFVGIFGAYVAWGLTWVLGDGAILLSFLILSWSIAQWSGRKPQGLSLKLFSGTLFFVSVSSLLSLMTGTDPAAQFRSGGVVGYFSATFFQYFFGSSAIIVSALLCGLSVLLATEFLILPLIISFYKKAIKPWRRRPWKDFQKRFLIAPFRIGSAAHSWEKKRPPKINISRESLSLENKLPTKPPVIRTVLSSTKNPAAPADRARSEKPITVKAGDYTFPSMDFLKIGDAAPVSGNLKGEINDQSRLLEDTLADFSIEAKVVEVERGPVITRFELQPASGVKVQKIVALQDNIALALQATSVRIIAPIPGKARVGIEVPNRVMTKVTLKEVLNSSKFRSSKSKLTVALGKDTGGTPITADLDDLPHLLIAGSTGSGKTVCINAIIMSLLYNASPDEVKMILIDPKMVELNGYNGLPHLITPVITDTQKVPSVLNWLISEMEIRYKTLSNKGARNIQSFNEKHEEKLPFIVVVIDELADLMMSLGKEVENAITRLSQLARAVGIHLVFATQRPSVDVITGVIKANFPARLSFQVASKVDSRTVLDTNGADQLLGKGDLLYLDPRSPKPYRAQGALVTDQEIEDTVDFIRNQRKPQFNQEVLKSAAKKTGTQDFRGDEFYEEACRVVVAAGQASVSMLQRRLGLGYTRAARLVDMMEEDGIVGPHRGAKMREILMDLDTLTAKQEAGSEEKLEKPKEA